MVVAWRTARALAVPAVLAVMLFAAVDPADAAAPPPHRTAGAAPPPHRHWSWPDLAHTSTVWSVTQGADGRLWIATREGLVRFDGRAMTPFDAARVPGLAAREVTSVVEGRDGVLWVGAREGGLFAVRLQTDRQLGLPGELRGEVIARTPALVIRQMAEGPDGTLWIAAHNGMARVPPGERVARFVNEGLPSVVSTRVTIDAGGTPWAGTAAGAARWDGRRWQLVAGSSPLPADALLADADGTVWVGFRGHGLWRWRPGTPDASWRVFADQDGGLGKFAAPLALLRDRGGRLWVAGAGGGLGWLDGERLRALETPASLCADRALGLTEDREEGLWLSTNGCGVHRLRPTLFRPLGVAEGLPAARAVALATVDGAPWVATPAGVARFDGARFQPLPCWPGRCDDCVRIAPAPTGGAWLSCPAGAVHLTNDAASPASARTDARAVVETVDGARWLDTGADILREVGGVATPVREAARLGRKRLIHAGRAGRVWIAGTDGVLLWDRGAVTVRPWGPLGPADPASVHDDADGALWVATRGGGVRQLRGERVVQLDARHGLHGWIAQVLPDPDGAHLWLSSSRGLLRVARAAVEEVIAGRRATVTPTLFDARDGVALADLPFFGAPAGLEVGGRLWFATNEGAVVVDPGALRVAAPPVSVDEIRVGGRAVPVARAASGGMTAPQAVELRFAAVTFEPPESVTTRYLLEGRDAHWNEAGAAAVARYDGVPAGHHRFRVRAVSRDGTSLGPETSVAVVLATPIHRRPWFAGALAAAAAGALFWAHRLRLSRARAGMRAILGERTRIARDIHDTLAQAFVATSVQLECIDTALEKGDVPGAKRHLASARDVVTGSLDEARRSVWVLRPQMEGGLPAALQALAQRTTGQPRVTFTLTGTPRALPPSVEAHLLRIAQEAVANAARHAHARTVRVQLEVGAKMVRLSIEDDGTGFAPGGADPGVPHQGLRNMRERAAEVGGRITIDSTAAGTTVAVEVAA